MNADFRNFEGAAEKRRLLFFFVSSAHSLFISDHPAQICGEIL